MSYLSNFLHRVRAAIGISIFLASFTLANADSQDLTTAPLSFSVDAGSTGLEVTVSYDTTPTGLQTTGAGISVFYDSSKLTFVSLAETYDEDLTQATRTPDSVVADSANLDDNTATDKRAIIAYTSFTGAWPDEDDSDRPLELFKVTFDAASASWAGETPINLVITSGAAGYTATNPSVTVEFLPDQVLPEITAPSAISVEAEGSTGTAATNTTIAAFLTGATASDNIDGDVSANITTDAPTTFAVGATTVTFTILDSSSNSATATATVTVVDTTGPIVSAPAALTVAATDAAGTAATDTSLASYLTSGTALDLVNGEVAVTTNAPSVFPLGSTTVTFSASDSSGNGGSATSTVTVSDQTAPSITAAAITIEATSSAGASLTATNIAAATTVSDNVDGTDVTVTSDAAATLPLDVATTVTYTATDSASNAGSASATVTVEDTTAPVITVAERAVVTLDVAAVVPATNAIIADYLASATATDLVDGSVTVSNDATADSYNVGTVSVTFTATDAHGNTTTASGSIVVDVGATITVPASIVVVSADGSALDTTQPLIAAYFSGVSATDVEDGAVDVTNDAPATFAVGVTTITFSATNSRDKTTTLTGTITVVTPASDADTDGDGIDDLFETDNGLDPNLDDASVDADSDGRTNLNEYLEGKDPNADDVDPVVTPPTDLTVDATGRLSTVDLGTASATDVLDGSLTPSSDLSGAFAPGTHTITWSAADAAGNTGTSTQTLKVRPLVEVASKGRTAEGDTFSLGIHLNGAAPDYPVSVPVTVSGTATVGADYSAVAETVTIASGRSGSLSIVILDDGVSNEDVETVVVTLGTPQNGNAALGPSIVSTVSIVEAAVPPSLSISVSQAGVKGKTVAATGGEVSAVVTVTDPNGNHTYDWSRSDNNVVGTSTTSATFSFDPMSLVGVYEVVVDVTDDGIADTTYAASALIKVAASAEADSDEDGIPDSSDTTEAANELSVDAGSDDDATISADPGVKLVVGGAAFANGVAGAAVDESIIAAGGEDGGDQPTNGEDALFVFPGGIYDFEIQELPEPGQSVNVLIPLSTPIPADGSYRKYTEAGGWVEFVTDTKNALASAAGGAGDSCPQAGSSSYQSGLNAGHLCLQLTLEDGGPNDADGQVNGVIDDPGGIAAPDADSDGVADSDDTDDDNDGVADVSDAFPFDPAESVDTDSDGIGNNADTDDDGDGVLDADDALPLDATETVDTDGDGIGNNADNDDDGDGTSDAADAFPLDSMESVDTDGDGIGNNADSDDDNDGVPDATDIAPLDSTRHTKSERGGAGSIFGCSVGNGGGSDASLPILLLLSGLWFVRRRKLSLDGGLTES